MTEYTQICTHCWSKFGTSRYEKYCDKCKNVSKEPNVGRGYVVKCKTCGMIMYLRSPRNYCSTACRRHGFNVTRDMSKDPSLKEPFEFIRDYISAKDVVYFRTFMLDFKDHFGRKINMNERVAMSAYMKLNGWHKPTARRWEKRE